MKGVKVMTKAVFQLDEITCPSCVKKIETTLMKIAGVDEAEVLFNSGKVKAYFDENKISAEQLEKNIKRLGYQVLSTKIL